MWIDALFYASMALVSLGNALGATSQSSTIVYSVLAVSCLALAVIKVIQTMPDYDNRSKRNHPEARLGEIFLKNGTPADFAREGWKTRRMGSIAYDERGNRLVDEKLLFPIFIKRSEFSKTHLPDKVLAQRRSERQAL